MKVVVMLLWVGAGNGGLATVQGFDTAEACRRAVPAVQAAYKGMYVDARARCVELDRGVADDQATHAWP